MYIQAEQNLGLKILDLPKSGSIRMRVFDRNLLKLGYNRNFKKYTINVKSLVPKYKHSTIKT